MDIKELTFSALMAFQYLCEKRLERLSRRISLDGTGRKGYEQCLSMLEAIDKETERRIIEMSSEEENED